MRKKILLTVIMCLFCQLSFAKVYVVFDKETGEIKGTSSISDKHILDWTKKHIVREGGEKYRGKHHWEIKYENGELRLATEQEVADYLAQKEQEKQDTLLLKRKQELLELLDDNEIKSKIKEIKDEPVTEPIMMGAERNWRGKIKDYLVNLKNKMTNK